LTPGIRPAHAGDRAAKLTQQLLAYSRRQILVPQLVDPNALPSRICAFVEPLVRNVPGNS
jgi:hypothetical protein